MHKEYPRRPHFEHRLPVWTPKWVFCRAVRILAADPLLIDCADPQTKTNQNRKNRPNQNAVLLHFFLFCTLVANVFNGPIIATEFIAWQSTFPVKYIISRENVPVRTACSVTFIASYVVRLLRECYGSEDVRVMFITRQERSWFSNVWRLNVDRSKRLHDGRIACHVKLFWHFSRRDVYIGKSRFPS